MGLFDRVRGRKESGEPHDSAPEAAVDLGPLVERVARLVPLHERAAPDLALFRARLGDRFRDRGVAPIPSAAWEERVSGLDDEACRRLGLLVGMLESDELGRALPGALAHEDAETWLERALVVVARHSAPLTFEVLRASPIRVEELVRRFLAHFPVAIRGETAAESVARLDRLDYGKLLEEAERAKKAAEDKGYLKKLQKEDDARRVRRGKN